MRISDWSSDVSSSALQAFRRHGIRRGGGAGIACSRYRHGKPPSAFGGYARTRRQVMQHPALDEDDDAIERDADQGQENDGHEYHRGIAGALAEGQQVAEPDIAADQLADPIGRAHV